MNGQPPAARPSTAWRRTADLRPRLRSHVQIERREERGRLWYVLRDAVSGRYHRLSPAAYLAVGLMDGRRSMADIHEIVARRLGDEAPAVDELARLLAQLHSADAVSGIDAPDLEEIWRRGAGADRRRLLMQLRSPLAIRIPLVDPERLLNATQSVGGLLFSPIGFALWLLVVGYALVHLGDSWGALTANIADRVLAAENIAIVLIAFPLLKILHELGHGYAVKRMGGEVHEMGVMFLVLMPVPYVDASAASGFPSKWSRFTVGAAGMYVEFLLAALAFIAWREMEPGFARSVMFNIMLIGGATTLFFNANPLLRFDGYFMLSDAIEISNLGPRANRYIGWLFKRYLFGMKRAPSPALADGEASWFFFYAIASFGYRMFVIFAIAFFISQQFFFIGVGLAIWALVLTLIWPAIKIVRWLFIGPDLAGFRRRALLSAGAMSAAAAALLFVAPAPFATVLHGVVWSEEEAEVTAETDGFLVQLTDRDGKAVCDGCLIARLDEPSLDAQIEVVQARLAAVVARRRALLVRDRVEAEMLLEEISHLEERLKEARARKAAADIFSPSDGRLMLIAASDMQGAWVRRGDLLGYVVQSGRLVVRAVAAQDEIDLIRSRNQGVDVMISANEPIWVAGRIARATPAGARRLPSLSLATSGGGMIALDPTADAADGPRTLEEVFELEIGLDAIPPGVRISQRAFVRISHGAEPLGFQLWRQARQLFLRQFDV